MLFSLLPYLAVASAAVVPRAGNGIVFKNSCKDKIDVGLMGYSNPSLGAIPIDAGATGRLEAPGFQGVVYSISDAASQWGMGGATKAAISLKTGHYYILKDAFNVGVRITPPQTVSKGDVKCTIPECTDAKCTTAADKWQAFGADSLVKAPQYFCDETGDWAVEFCPTSSVPGTKGIEIHPNGDKKKCLDVTGNIQKDGTAVQVYDCNGSGAQKWEVAKNQTAVRLAGSNFCLDAGSKPAAGTPMKIWTCYDKLASQTMWYTADNRIAVKDTGLCLTRKDGAVSTERCTDGNVNQIWN